MLISLKREIDVRRQVQRANQHQVEIRAPKYGSKRTIYAPDALITMLSEHVRLYRPGDDPDRWLFPGELDQPLHQNSVGYWWRRARGAAGLSYRLHDLRHFYVGPDRRGCDVVTVQRARALIRERDAVDLLPPVARRERPHPESRWRAIPGLCRSCCGRTADGWHLNQC